MSCNVADTDTPPTYPFHVANFLYTRSLLHVLNLNNMYVCLACVIRDTGYAFSVRPILLLCVSLLCMSHLKGFETKTEDIQI